MAIKRNKPELLAPAGDLECLETAIHFGADAVYIGGPFLQLRAGNVGFSEEDIKKAALICHENNVKLYVTVNCFAKNDEIDKVPEYAEFLKSCGVDAVIVSDIGLISKIRKSVPDLQIHVSTQANCQNYEAAMVYKEMGASRVVLGREMSLEEIKKLHEKCGDSIEIEAFVHGAMCMAYSGRCMISSFLTGRSGNRGGCTQPCRWKYALMEEKRPGEYFPLEENEKGTAILSSHDMCAVSFLEELSNAGVVSFKIEGRMKTPLYVGTVVNAYRHAIDKDLPMDVIENELDSISHRPYSSAFYFGDMVKNHSNSGEYIQKCRFAAKVLDFKDNIIKIEQRNNFKVGDELEIVSPHFTGYKFKVQFIRDESKNERTSAELVQQILYINCPVPLVHGDMLRLRKE